MAIFFTGIETGQESLESKAERESPNVFEKQIMF